MFYVQLALLGGFLGPMKSDLGLFWPFRATYFIRKKHTFCKKGHFPQQIWLKTCAWIPKHLPDLNPRAHGQFRAQKYRLGGTAEQISVLL